MPLSRPYYEIYNIIYILSHICYLTTLSFYLVLEDEFISKYYVMLLFVPISLNYYCTYIKNYIKISLIINFVYIQTKLIFMITYFNYKEDNDELNTKNEIIYGVLLYLIFFIEVTNMIYFYFYMLINHHNSNAEIIHYSAVQ